MSALETGTLYYGDCLDWMQRWDDRCVDLIYLDPPFNWKSNCNVLYSSESGHDAQYRAFGDTGTWDEGERYGACEGSQGRRAHDAIVGLYRVLGPSGMLAYVTYMAERLEHMQRLLKPTGSIYLHCDPTAGHYLKIVMDAIFEARNCLNEISWLRTVPKNDYTQGAVNWPRMRDVLMHYRASPPYARFKQPLVPLSRENAEKQYSRREPETGRRYQLTALNAPGAGTREHPRYELLGVTRYWRYSESKMRELLEAGRIVQTAPGRVPRYKRYLDESKGVAIGDSWTDISALQGGSKEYSGYPTQKPLALLERVIEASSNEGDVSLDPFCGCGTAVEAAAKLGRRWAGIDISTFAIDLIVERRLKGASLATKGIPTDLASARKLAREQPFNFESWAVTRLPGFASNTKQVGDGGIDGRAVLVTKPDDFDSRLALTQIKGGKFSLSMLRDFIHVTNRDKAALGWYVTLDSVSTPASKAEIAYSGKISVAGYPDPRMQTWPVAHNFDQRLPSMPIMNDPYSGKPMTQGLLL